MHDSILLLKYMRSGSSAIFEVLGAQGHDPATCNHRWCSTSPPLSLHPQTWRIGIPLLLGAALENSLRFFFSITFFSQYKIVDMVCCMNIHHERFWTKNMLSCPKLVFSRFSLVLLANMQFWWVFYLFCLLVGPPNPRRLHPTSISYIRLFLAKCTYEVLAGEKKNWTDRLIPRGDFVLWRN